MKLLMRKSMQKKIILMAIELVMTSSIANFANAGNFEEGTKAYSAKNYRLAENYFRLALGQEPSNSVIKYYLAITLVRNNKTSDAKLVYRNIIATSSEPSVVHYAQAGLKALGETSSVSYSGASKSRPSNATKAILNVDSQGTLLIIDNVYLNNKEKVKYIFDTGASYTTISSNLAKKLGISTVNAPKVKIMSATGYTYAPKVYIEKIEVNGLCAYNVEALVSDLPLHGSSSSSEIAGLLGLSFMKDFKVTVDRPNSQIIIEK